MEKYFVHFLLSEHRFLESLRSDFEAKFEGLELKRSLSGPNQETVVTISSTEPIGSFTAAEIENFLTDYCEDVVNIFDHGNFRGDRYAIAAIDPKVYFVGRSSVHDHIDAQMFKFAQDFGLQYTGYRHEYGFTILTFYNDGDVASTEILEDLLGHLKNILDPQTGQPYDVVFTWPPSAS